MHSKVHWIKISLCLQKVMNKEDEFPYGYHPDKNSLVVCILFLWSPLIAGMIDGSIVIAWIHLGTFYLIGAIACMMGYTVTYREMLFNNSISENGKNLLENETRRYILFALKQAVRWPIFLFEKE